VNELVGGFVGAGLAVVAGVVVTGVWMFLKRRIRLRSPLEALVEQIAEQVRCLTPIVGTIYAIQRPQLAAQAAILEALAGDNNGNLRKAHEGIEAATDRFDRFTNATVVPECKDITQEEVH
jgi:hypothetical protein